MKTLSLIITLTFFSAAAFAQAGNLDSTFNADGIATTDFASDGIAYSVAIQSDGKIIVAGDCYNGQMENIALVRYNTDGTLDLAFGGNGRVTTAIDSGAGALGVAIQQDGKIVVAGGSFNGMNYDFALVRYNTDGSLDNSFSTDGVVTTSISSGDDVAYSVVLQSDGKIVAAGLSYGTYSNSWDVVRYNGNGSLDSSFSTDGVVITSIGSGSAEAHSVAIQPDGKIVVAGFSQTDGFALVLYNADGNLDSSFNNDGIATTFITNIGNNATSVALQSDGKIVVAGYGIIVPDYVFALARFNSDGTIDNSFSNDGKLTVNLGVGFNKGYSVAIQPDGRIIEVGFSSLHNYDGSPFVLIRFNTDGTFDNSFGTNGIVTTTISPYGRGANAVVIQQDGKIVAVGDSNYHFAVARYLSGLNVGIINFSSSESSPPIYPNPIQQTETLEYTLEKNESLTIALYDVNGKLIRNFISNEERAAGAHKETLNMGELLSGNYFLTLSNGSQKMSVKMVKQ